MAIETGIAPNDIESARPGVQEEMLAILTKRESGSGGTVSGRLRERLRKFVGE